MDVIALLKLVKKGETMCAFCDNLECSEKDKLMDFEMKSEKGIIVLVNHCRCFSDRRKIDR